MRAKSTMPLVFFALSACGHAAPPSAAPPPAAPPRSASVARAPAEVALRSEPSTPPAHSVVEADRLYESQLDATRAAERELHRQVAELRRAVLLYQQFIERAEDEPTMAAAVRKSRERIDDACDTIVFLLQTSGPFNPHGC